MHRYQRGTITNIFYLSLMKNFITALILLLSLTNMQAQIVHDSVFFNNYASAGNNDLVNNFSNTAWITMDTLHGITGGALIPPNNVSWGNDMIQYCKTYSNVIDSTITASIFFKWNSALINTNLERAAAIFLEGDWGVNWSLQCYVNSDQRVTLMTYGTVNDIFKTFASGHWYLLSVYLTKSTTLNQMIAEIHLYDYGTTGLASPIPMGGMSQAISDSMMYQSTQYSVHVCGARWGGGEYLDNFSSSGIPSQITCASVGINQIANAHAITVYPQPASGMAKVKIEGCNAQYVTCLIRDEMGKIISESRNAYNNYLTLDIVDLPAGIYFMELNDGLHKYRKQLVVGD